MSGDMVIAEGEITEWQEGTVSLQERGGSSREEASPDRASKPPEVRETNASETGDEKGSSEKAHRAGGDTVRGGLDRLPAPQGNARRTWTHSHADTA